MKRISLYTFIAITLMLVVCLAGCNEEIIEEAANVAESYNMLVEKYNSDISPYNEAIDSIVTANTSFNTVIDGAQASIDRGEKPFDIQTEADLKDGIAAANEAVISVPDKITEKKMVSVDESWDKKDLEQFISDTNISIETLSKTEIPNLPEVPDYEEDITTLTNLQQAYEDSIQGLKQITAPSDEFVMKRLQRVKTITAMEAVTEDHDPNGKLNKQGGYIGCIYFTDTRVDRSEVYTLDGTGCVDVENEGGGTVEIFANEKDVIARDDYLTSTQSIAFASPGSHYVRGTCVIRTSEHLKASEQQSLTEAITKALIAVKIII